MSGQCILYILPRLDYSQSCFMVSVVSIANSNRHVMLRVQSRGNGGRRAQVRITNKLECLHDTRFCRIRPVPATELPCSRASVR